MCYGERLLLLCTDGMRNFAGFLQMVLVCLKTLGSKSWKKFFSLRNGSKIETVEEIEHAFGRTNGRWITWSSLDCLELHLTKTPWLVNVSKILSLIGIWNLESLILRLKSRLLSEANYTTLDLIAGRFESVVAWKWWLFLVKFFHPKLIVKPEALKFLLDLIVGKIWKSGCFKMMALFSQIFPP